MELFSVNAMTHTESNANGTYMLVWLRGIVLLKTSTNSFVVCWKTDVYFTVRKIFSQFPFFLLGLVDSKCLPFQSVPVFCFVFTSGGQFNKETASVVFYKCRMRM